MGRAARGGEDEEVTPGLGRWEALTAFPQAEQLLRLLNESSPLIRRKEANTGSEITVRCAPSEINLTAALPELWGAGTRGTGDDG